LRGIKHLNHPRQWNGFDLNWGKNRRQSFKDCRKSKRNETSDGNVPPDSQNHPDTD
jgi:hypothetical protein